MKTLSFSQMHAVSGGDGILSVWTDMSNDEKNGILVGTGLGVLKSVSTGIATLPTYALGGAILGYVASGPIGFVIDNGLIEDYLNGDLCAVAKKVWPFQRRKRAAAF